MYYAKKARLLYGKFFHMNTDVDVEAKRSEEAAVKIQAGYRGYVARKEVEAIRKSESTEAVDKGECLIYSFLIL